MLLQRNFRTRLNVPFSPSFFKVIVFNSFTTDDIMQSYKYYINFSPKYN